MKKYFIGFSLFPILLLSFQIISGQPINPSFSKNIVKETNQFRRSKGLHVLISRNDLNVIAQKHSTDMARGKVAFGHDGFNERSQKAKKALSGKMKGFAENVAVGAKNARQVVKGWENSAGHRRNMLGNYKYIGVGIAADKNGRLYYTQIFVN
jgi:uncharacterized protein YkwD